MTERAHHLRYVVLCCCLLLALVVIAWIDVDAGKVLWESLAFVPLSFAAIFLFNRFHRRRERGPNPEETREDVPTEAEARVGDAIYFVTLVLGVICIAVAALAPSYLTGAVWLVPALGCAAGIHSEAIT